MVTNAVHIAEGIETNDRATAVRLFEAAHERSECFPIGRRRTSTLSQGLANAEAKIQRIVRKKTGGTTQTLGPDAERL